MYDIVLYYIVVYDIVLYCIVLEAWCLAEGPVPCMVLCDITL